MRFHSRLHYPGGRNEEAPGSAGGFFFVHDACLSQAKMFAEKGAFYVKAKQHEKSFSGGRIN
jgi:hypothetical protein